MRVRDIEIGATYPVEIPAGRPSRLFGAPGSGRIAEMRRLCGARFELTVTRVDASVRFHPIAEGVGMIEASHVELRFAKKAGAGDPRDGRGGTGHHLRGELFDRDGRRVVFRGTARIRVPVRWLRRGYGPVS